jgi:succinoglycan biosynthesis transport protein ExoP
MLQHGWGTRAAETGAPRAAYVGAGPVVTFAALARHRRLMFGVVAALLAIALAYVWLRPPSFTASGRLVVDNRVLQMSAPNAVFTTSASSTGWAGPHVLSQVEILRSRRVAEAALARLEAEGTGWVPELNMTDHIKARLGWSSRSRPEEPIEAFRRQFRITRIGETFAIEIRASSEDAGASARLVNALMASYLGEIAAANAEASRAATAWLRDAAREAGSTARIISEAVAPERRDGPSAPYVMIVALIGSLMAGTGAALTAALLDRKIRTAEALKAAVDGDVLGAIPKYRRAVKADCPPADFRSVMETLRVVLTLERTDVRCVGITAPDAKSGSTTVAQALAHSSARAGLRTLLLETRADHTDDDHNVAAGLVVRSVPPQVLTDRAPAALFKPETAEAYDFVVVDLPPLSPPAVVRAAARFVDGYVIVVAAGDVDADALVEALDAAGPVRHRALGFVLNKAGSPARRTGRIA